jgi:hypothetical protein
MQRVHDSCKHLESLHAECTTYPNDLHLHMPLYGPSRRVPEGPRGLQAPVASLGGLLEGTDTCICSVMSVCTIRVNT